MKILSLCSLVLLILSPVANAASDVLETGDNVKITFQRNRSVTDIRDGSIGAKLAEFEPLVKIQNAAMHDYPGNKVRVIVMGEDTNRANSWKVINLQEFDANLEMGRTFEWIGQSFEQGFDRTLAKSGYDYDGFIALIRNSEGKVVIAAASKPVWISDLERAWNLEDGKEYKRDFFKK